MKKVISLVVLVSIILVANTVLAASAKVNVTGQTAIEEGTKTVTMTVSLGAFDDVAEGETLGFQATLEYNNNIFDSVTVQGLNGWDVSYEDSSKVVTGLTKSSKANVQIATFTFTPKSSIASVFPSKPDLILSITSSIVLPVADAIIEDACNNLYVFS